ncbi:hypothetical protein CO172_03450 [Candidatus Uhrbacteria bacterium CG_4_9_14_3_um_filter_36_7]|uniref:DUF8128 domain-containing protein n=1 Tax=Candidatus Uhrbacteria bacterium CG_4_9_14_3_um_filter_36_7 TaxID=1975033 RepID=A0A2M7XGA1_9BACT|nr:MAG: hypothetical protein CO172_03450 [Candidatus Uhrbacteria bacterium CG_4_9_14_3_um_filter_36_7]
MWSVFAVIFEETTTRVAPTGLLSFFSQPIDVVLFQILLFVGWIPILTILLWGFGQIWLDTRKDKYKSILKWTILAIDVPRLTEQSPKAMENVFSTIQGTKSTPSWKQKWVYGVHGIKSRFSFEIVSDGGYIQFYIRCPDRYRDLVEASIYAQYPDAEIQIVDDYINTVPTEYPNEESWRFWGTEFFLKQPSYLPIRTWIDFEHTLSQQLKDPLAVILEQLSRLEPGEKIWIQIVFEAGGQDWKKEGEKAIDKFYGKQEKPKESILDQLFAALLWLPSAFLEALTGGSVNLLSMFGFATEPKKEEKKDTPKLEQLTIPQKNQVESIAKKIQKIGFQTKIRVLYFGKGKQFRRPWRVVMLKGMFQQFTNQGLNEFALDPKVTPDDEYFWLKWSYDRRLKRLFEGYRKRDFAMGATPFILNTEELATIYHFPSIDIKAPLVKKTEARRAEPPVGLPVAFGEDEGIFLSPPPQAKAPKEVKPPEPPSTASSSRPLTVEEKEETFQINLPPIDDKEKHTEPHLPTPPTSTKPNHVSTHQVSFKKSRKIPDAMRVLIEPGVELEDINIEPQTEEDDSSKNQNP